MEPVHLPVSMVWHLHAKCLELPVVSSVPSQRGYIPAVATTSSWTSLRVRPTESPVSGRHDDHVQHCRTHQAAQNDQSEWSVDLASGLT